MMMNKLVIPLILIIFVSSPSLAQDYTIPWDTFGQGGQGSSSVAHTLRDIIGQVAVGESTDSYSISSGFFSITIFDISPPGVSITTPIAGAKVSGTAVLIKTSTQNTDIASIRFQYRSSNPGVWMEIISSTDTRSIFSVSWNTTGLANGRYDLRAIAKDKANNEDPNPPIITVIIDHSHPDYSEDEVKKNVDSVIERGDGTRVKIPAGALKEDTIIKIATPAPGEIPPPKDNPTGLYVKITLESGQKVLNKPVTIFIPYPDADNNGIVDGTNILEENLRVNIWNGTSWDELPTTIDAVNNIATGTTTHFSIFGVFGAFAPDLEDVLVYPNPFRPAEGDTTVKFANLTSNVTIRIYNVAGELVRMQEDITTGAWEWDGENDYGKIVAYGCYIYIITNDDGKKKIGKIVVVR